MARIAMLILAGTLLAACEAKLNLPGPDIRIGSGGSGGGYHCPPGQAKKGNC